MLPISDCFPHLPGERPSVALRSLAKLPGEAKLVLAGELPRIGDAPWEVFPPECPRGVVEPLLCSEEGRGMRAMIGGEGEMRGRRD